MHRRDLLKAAALSPAALAAAEAGPAQVQARTQAVSLDHLLQPYLAHYNLPALAAAVVVSGSVVAAGAIGTRRAGTNTPVTLDDRFHIGSCTKAMTALVAATFVEEGALRWDSTIGEVFPELAETMNLGLRGVTLEQLLSNSSGIPSDNETISRLFVQSYEISTQFLIDLLDGPTVSYDDGLNLDGVRYWLLQQWSQQPHPLQSPPGSRYAYSNLGFIIAGAMLERTGDATWEELVVARLFEPLGLETAGFGPQASVGRVNAPLPHFLQSDGTLMPILGGPGADAPLVVGPAGTVHLSILDFAAWAGWNAGEGRRGPALVRSETLRKLHTKIIDIPPPPADAGYGLGWGIQPYPFSPQPFVIHTGSNDMNFAAILLQPKRDFAMVLATNVYSEEVSTLLSIVAEQLYRRFAPNGD
jgi:CubicO group peptidase (beta-lactamase class C family)